MNSAKKNKKVFKNVLKKKRTTKERVNSEEVDQEELDSANNSFQSEVGDDNQEEQDQSNNNNIEEVPVDTTTPKKRKFQPNGALNVETDNTKTSKKTQFDTPQSATDNDAPVLEQKQEEQPTRGDFKLTEQSFETLNISQYTKDALKEMGISKLTEIQAKSIVPLMEGKDLVGKAKTGSGKTLSFLIPAIELLLKERFTPRKGTGIIVLTPTRELALQIYGVVHELLKFHSFTHGVVMGGANRKAEQEKLLKGVNLLVCTPGRLLDHLINTKGFIFDSLKALIIDETDRILDVGYEDELKQIVKALPKERQTMLFSATQTQKVEDIMKLSIKGVPVFVSVEDRLDFATNSTLEQGYVIVGSDARFLLLFTFLKKNRNKKVIVFFSSCNSVKFHGELFNFIDIPVLDLHGKQKQTKRTNTFFEFCNAKSGILLCTDVAARGLDIPEVDWIIQYDPPDDPKEYIHRVGRTARAGRSGKALLFLLPEEVAFLKYLKAARVPLNEYDFPQSKIVNVQAQLEKLVEKNFYLNVSARDAYKSYLQSYASHGHKDIFNVNSLDLIKVGKSFGFTAPPKVALSLSAKAKGNRPRDKTKQQR